MSIRQLISIYRSHRDAAWRRPLQLKRAKMSNAASPFLGFANFVMAATPLLAVLAYIVLPSVR